MSRRVIIKLMGGLGNQMLQYATGFSLAKKLQAVLWLDVNYYKIDRRLNNTHREFELSFFGVQHTQYNGLLSNYLLNKIILKSGIIRKQLMPLDSLFYYTDDDNLLLAHNHNKNGTYYLDGYWTSLSYFDDDRKDLLNLFNLSRCIDNRNEAIFRSIREQNSIAIHVRRTDYMLPSSSHKVLPIEYYRRALEIIQSSEPNSVVYLFGDDYKWIRDNFPIDSIKYILISHNAGVNAHIDMALMSQCKHLIISNSTFSWWAAYLNQREGKKIVPDQWFLPGKSPYFVYNNFIPTEWVRVEA